MAVGAAMREPSLRAESIEYIAVVGPRRGKSTGPCGSSLFPFDSAKLTSSDGEHKKKAGGTRAGKRIARFGTAEEEQVNTSCKQGMQRFYQIRRKTKKKGTNGFSAWKKKMALSHFK